MSAQPENTENKNIRHVVLPSGRTIQVVYFGQASGPGQVAGSAASEATDLHVCVECQSTLVYPVDWDEAGTTHWRVSLRCPNCEWTTEGVYEQDVVERFDCELDRGTEALMRDLQRLTRANMEDDVERFVTALRDDHILPVDF
jgi:hypothetical protein